MFSNEDLAKTLKSSILRDKRDLKKLVVRDEEDKYTKEAIEKRIDYMKRLLKRVTNG